MGRRGNPAVVGAFVVAGIALAIGAVLAFGAGLFGGRRYPYVAYFSGSVNGLSVGAPVKFRGVQIGQVKSIRLEFGPIEGPARIPVTFEIDGERISQLGAGDGRDLGDRERLKERIAAGLRAQLQTESFVTGVLYVELDYAPDTPVHLVRGDESPIPEVPTLPTTLEKVQQLFAQAVGTIEGIDFGEAVRKIADAADGVAKLARSPEIPKAFSGVQEVLAEARRVLVNVDAQIAPLARGLDGTGADARATLASVRATVARMDALVDPDAPLPVELRRTVADLGEAARAVRELASYLERRPNALLFGKTGDGE